jgi:hypothetical protein
MDVLSEGTNFSARRRTIHTVTNNKPHDTRSLFVTKQKDSKKKKTVHARNTVFDNYTIPRPISEAVLWKNRTTKWEDFDDLAIGTLDEDALTTTAAITTDHYFGEAKYNLHEHTLRNVKSRKSLNYNYKTDNENAKAKKNKISKYKNYNYNDSN